MKILSLFILSLVAALPANALDIKGIDKIVSQGVANRRYPGAVLVIGQGDHLLYSRAFGHLTYDPKSPAVNLQTQFDLASVTKVAATTTAALLMLQGGKISVWDPVSKFVPEFAGSDVVIRDLLTHTSGLPAYLSPASVEKNRKPNQSHADALLAKYGDYARSNKRATKIVYSCLNMQTLARVVENVSHQRIEDLLRQHVWRKLGMNHTAFVLSSDKKQTAAPTARRADGSLLQGDVHDPIASYHGSKDRCPGNAGLFSTGVDLARFCSMILADGSYKGVSILDASLIKRATGQQEARAMAAARGFGWDIFESAAYTTPFGTSVRHQTFGHTGFTGTLLWLDKTSGVYMVFLTNAVFPPDSPPKGQSLFDIQRFLSQQCLTVKAAATVSPDSNTGEP